MKACSEKNVEKQLSLRNVIQMKGYTCTNDLAQKPAPT